MRADSGADNTETNRRDWRELLYTAPGLGQYISGAIMFEETLYQSCEDGTPFVDVLQKQGIVPGIKVDTGLSVRPANTPAACCISMLAYAGMHYDMPTVLCDVLQRLGVAWGMDNRPGMSGTL